MKLNTIEKALATALGVASLVISVLNTISMPAEVRGVVGGVGGAIIVIERVLTYLNGNASTSNPKTSATNAG